MSIDATAIEGVHAEIEAEVAAQERRVERELRRLEELRLELRGAEAFRLRLSRTAVDHAPAVDHAEASVRPAEKPPRRATGVADLVMTVLATAPEGMLLKTLVAVVQAEHGFNYEQVRSAVNHLRRRGDAEQVARAKWRLVQAQHRAPETTEDPAEKESAGSSVLPIRAPREGLTEGGEDGAATDHRNGDLPGWHDRDHHHSSVAAEG